MDALNVWLSSRQDLALPVFAALFGSTALLLVFAWLRSRRGAAERAEELKLAGLAPVELPPHVAERIRRLQTGGASLSLRNVWRAGQSDGELYMLDLWNTGGDSNSMTSQGLVVILSRKLALPRLHVIPRFENLGWFGKLLGPLFSRLMDWGAGRHGLSRVSFPDEPHLDAALLVVSSDPARARAFLGGSRSLWLAQLSAPLQWEGDGDLLCVRSWDWTGTKKAPSVSGALENARALYSVLTR